MHFYNNFVRILSLPSVKFHKGLYILRKKSFGYSWDVGVILKFDYFLAQI